MYNKIQLANQKKILDWCEELARKSGARRVVLTPAHRESNFYSWAGDFASGLIGARNFGKELEERDILTTLVEYDISCRGPVVKFKIPEELFDE